MINGRVSIRVTLIVKITPEAWAQYDEDEDEDYYSHLMDDYDYSEMENVF